MPNSRPTPDAPAYPPPRPNPPPRPEAESSPEAASSEPPPPPDASPLSTAHYQQLEAARGRRRRIDRAVRVATFSAWSIAISAALTAPFAVFSYTGLVAAVCLFLFAVVEFMGRDRLRRLQAAGPWMLGANELIFLCLILAYCLWSLHAAWTHPRVGMQYFAKNPQLRRQFGHIQHAYKLIVVAVYGGVALASVLFQGGLSLFYFTRAGVLRRYRDQTPTWILELERRQR